MSDKPSGVRLILRSGEEVPCLLEQVGPNRWQAVPVRDVELDEVADGYVDTLPPGAKVEFVLGGLE